jgi:hypothetical protein
MSEPLPAPAFDVVYEVRPTETSAPASRPDRSSSRGTGNAFRAAAIAVHAKRTVRGAHDLPASR